MANHTPKEIVDYLIETTGDPKWFVNTKSVGFQVGHRWKQPQFVQRYVTEAIKNLSKLKAEGVEEMQDNLVENEEEVKKLRDQAEAARKAGKRTRSWVLHQRAEMLKKRMENAQGGNNSPQNEEVDNNEYKLGPENYHKGTDTVWHDVKHKGVTIGTVGTNAKEHQEQHGKWGFEDDEGMGRKYNEPKADTREAALKQLIARHKANQARRSQGTNEEVEQIDERKRNNRNYPRGGSMSGDTLDSRAGNQLPLVRTGTRKGKLRWREIEDIKDLLRAGGRVGPGPGEKLPEEVEQIDEMHRVNVTVSDPNHSAVNMRKEKIQKIVRVKADNKEHAIHKATQYYKNRGYKIHDAEHVGEVNEEVEQLAEESPTAKIHWYSTDNLKQHHIDKLDRLTTGPDGPGQHLHYGENHDHLGFDESHVGTSADQPNHKAVKALLDKHAEKVSTAKMIHKEEVEQLAEESPTAGTRKVQDFPGKNGHVAQVRYNSDYREYSVHHYMNGKHLGEGPVSYHGSGQDGKEEAMSTAKHEAEKGLKLNEKKLSPKQKAIARLAGNKDALDAADFKALRSGAKVDEVAPPGREEQVKALKQVPGITNPWAVAWASYNKSKANEGVSWKQFRSNLNEKAELPEYLGEDYALITAIDALVEEYISEADRTTAKGLQKISHDEYMERHAAMHKDLGSENVHNVKRKFKLGLNKLLGFQSNTKKHAQNVYDGAYTMPKGGPKGEHRPIIHVKRSLAQKIGDAVMRRTGRKDEYYVVNEEFDLNEEVSKSVLSAIKNRNTPKATRDRLIKLHGHHPEVKKLLSDRGEDAPKPKKAEHDDEDDGDEKDLGSERPLNVDKSGKVWKNRGLAPSEKTQALRQANIERQKKAMSGPAHRSSVAGGVGGGSSVGDKIDAAASKKSVALGGSPAERSAAKAEVKAATKPKTSATGRVTGKGLKITGSGKED